MTWLPKFLIVLLMALPACSGVDSVTKKRWNNSENTISVVDMTSRDFRLMDAGSKLQVAIEKNFQTSNGSFFSISRLEISAYWGQIRQLPLQENPLGEILMERSGPISMVNPPPCCQMFLNKGGFTLIVRFVPKNFPAAFGRSAAGFLW